MRHKEDTLPPLGSVEKRKTEINHSVRQLGKAESLEDRQISSREEAEDISALVNDH